MVNCSVVIFQTNQSGKLSAEGRKRGVKGPKKKFDHLVFVNMMHFWKLILLAVLGVTFLPIFDLLFSFSLLACFFFFYIIML